MGRGSSGSARPRTLRWGLWGLGATLLLLILVAPGVRSRDKGDLAAALAALPKNAPIRELTTLPMEVDLGNGSTRHSLVYHHAGPRRPATGLPVVLIHNTPSTLYSWSEVIHGPSRSAPHAQGLRLPGLAKDREVYAIEVIGHGIAEGNGGPYSFERCARYVAGAIAALGLEQVHLVGSSYGGEFAWRAALNSPDRIASLTLINSSGYPRRDGDWLSEEVLMRESSLAKLGWLLNSRERITRALAPHFDPIPPGRVDEFFLVCENAENWGAMIDLVRDENGSRSSELADIPAPTLILWGERDLAYDIDHYGRRFAREIPGAEFVAVKESGHYPHEQQPAFVIQRLADFFSRVESAP